MRVWLVFLLVGCGLTEVPVLSGAPVDGGRDAGSPDVFDAGTDVDASVLIPPGRQVAAGSGHTCAIHADELFCWGSDTDQALGNGSAGDTLEPVRIGEGFVEVVTLGGHTCALDASGTLWCWGAGGRGQLGLGDRLGRDVPVEVPLPGVVAEVDVGSGHTCARLDDRRLFCWGENSEGQLGVLPESTGLSDLPLQVGDQNDWDRFRAGHAVSCGVRVGGALWCWGRNSTNQLGLGDGAPGQRRIPTFVGDDWSVASPGQNFACGLAGDGSLLCWGGGDSGQLGLGDLSSHSSPTRVAVPPTDAVDVDTFHSCSIRGDQMFCVGRNAEGQLGTGDTDDRLVPTSIPGTWTEVSTGRFHTCARDTDGAIWCTGANDTGKLGLGDTDRRNAFTRVLPTGPE